MSIPINELRREAAEDIKSFREALGGTKDAKLEKHGLKLENGGIAQVKDVKTNSVDFLARTKLITAFTRLDVSKEFIQHVREQLRIELDENGKAINGERSDPLPRKGVAPPKPLSARTVKRLLDEFDRGYFGEGENVKLVMADPGLNVTNPSDENGWVVYSRPGEDDQKEEAGLGSNDEQPEINGNAKQVLNNNVILDNDIIEEDNAPNGENRAMEDNDIGSQTQERQIHDSKDEIIESTIRSEEIPKQENEIVEHQIQEKQLQKPTDEIIEPSIREEKIHGPADKFEIAETEKALYGALAKNVAKPFVETLSNFPIRKKDMPGKPLNQSRNKLVHAAIKELAESFDRECKGKGKISLARASELLTHGIQMGLKALGEEFAKELKNYAGSSFMRLMHFHLTNIPLDATLKTTNFDLMARVFVQAINCDKATETKVFTPIEILSGFIPDDVSRQYVGGGLKPFGALTDETRDQFVLNQLEIRLSNLNVGGKPDSFLAGFRELANNYATANERAKPAICDYLMAFGKMAKKVKDDQRLKTDLHCLVMGEALFCAFGGKLKEKQWFKQARGALDAMGNVLDRIDENVLKNPEDAKKAMIGAVKEEVGKNDSFVELFPSVKDMQDGDLYVALLKPFHDLSHEYIKADNKIKLETVLQVESGGGLKLGYKRTFKGEGKNGEQTDFTSTVTPADQLLRQNGITPPVDGKLDNFAMSELSEKGNAKPLVRFLRFGNRNREGGGVITMQQEQLVTQMFLANEELVRQAEADPNKTIDIPVYRLNMGDDDPFDANRFSSFYVTFCRPGGKPVTVCLKPQDHPFRLPTDSNLGKNGVVVDKTHWAKTKESIESLIERARDYLDRHKTKAEQNPDLKRRLDSLEILFHQVDYFYFATSVAFINGDSKTLREQMELIFEYDEHIGMQLHQLGARLALMVSLMDEIPSINCTQGRDRTGAMDSEIKMLAQMLTEGKKLPEIHQKPKDVPDDEKKSRFQHLTDTGNQDIARITNFGAYDMNLKQSEHNSLSNLYPGGDKVPA